jgi:hypothetical protein
MEENKFLVEGCKRSRWSRADHRNVIIITVWTTVMTEAVELGGGCVCLLRRAAVRERHWQQQQRKSVNVFKQVNGS